MDVPLLDLRLLYASIRGDVQAAVLRVKRPHLLAWNERRRANARLYRELFHAAGLTSRVRLPVEPPDRVHIYHQFVVRVPERDRVRAHLASCGVGTEVYYPVSLHAQDCFAHLGVPAGSCPRATAMSRDCLALPIFPELTREQQEYVVSSIAGALR